MNLLKSLGLTEIEEKVYLAVLKEGPATPLELSRRHHISRSTIYQKIESLADRGFISWTTIKGQKVAKAEDPQVIKESLTREEDRIASLKSHFDHEFPKLAQLYHPASEVCLPLEGLPQIVRTIQNTSARAENSRVQIVFNRKFNELSTMIKTIRKSTTSEKIALRPKPEKKSSSASFSLLLFPESVVFVSKDTKNLSGWQINDKTFANILNLLIK